MTGSESRLVQGPPITHFAQAVDRCPAKPGLICVPGDRVITIAELDELARRSAHAFRSCGLQQGDCVAIRLPNNETMVAAILAAQRVGLYYTLIPTFASFGDTDYITVDSQSRLLLTWADDSLPPRRPQDELPYRVWRCGGEPDAPDAWEALLARQPTSNPADLAPGIEMIYTSGTTGRPKGVRNRPLTQRWDDPDPRNVEAARSTRIDSDSVLLQTSPLYHSAPHRYLNAALNVGATVVLMNRFDPELSLACIDRFRCTHSLWVPTMFHRLLKLDEDRRRVFSGRSHRVAVHGAAPCPVHVKRAMIDWWGPILTEYYSGTEGVGRTVITSAEWLAHPGSVGRPRDCVAHILDDRHVELPTGAIGTVYFESRSAFSYWRDPEKTRTATSPQGWRTFGDVGYLDADGYLYLTDRKGFMVISGGVNVYPQEIESVLLSHPDVLDAAAFGVPDDDLGERLVAVVQLADGVEGDAEKERALKAHCRAKLGGVKTPKSVIFRSDFPRLENGKVQKHLLRDWFLNIDVSHGRVVGGEAPGGS